MHSLITGCAGFIGSHIARSLIDSGDTVVGIDCFTDYYDKKLKEENIKGLLKSDRFTFLKEDLLTTGVLEGILSKTDCVFHLAAQPGVRTSWGKNFEIYIRNNILVTHKLLESAREFSIKKFVFASSSSVYGDSELPMKEDGMTRPVSPYGISKLTGENMCSLYGKSFGVPVVSLRYFTVFGPGQRPDMAFNRFIRAIIKGEEIIIFGDGSQTRDFTYIDDIVRGTIKASRSGKKGVYNIGGGSRMVLNDAIKLIEDITGKKARVKYKKKEKGDVRDTFADIGKARKELKYKPDYDVKKGLEKEVEWIKATSGV